MQTGGMSIGKILNLLKLTFKITKIFYPWVQFYKKKKFIVVTVTWRFLGKSTSF